MVVGVKVYMVEFAIIWGVLATFLLKRCLDMVKV
jgi:hypothetical protein